MPTSDASAGVVLDVDYRAGCFELVLVNSGAETAREVAVKFSKKLVGVGGGVVVSELAVWTGLGTMRPGKEIRVFYDTAPNVFHRRGKNDFTATVTWTTAEGDHKAAYRHDLDVYRDMPEVVPDRR